MTKAVRRGIGIVAATVLIGVFGFSLWSWAAHHQLPWESLPDRVHACGRDFAHAEDGVGAGPVTRAEVVREGAREVDSWWTFRGRVEVWAGSPCGGTGLVRTPTGVFVRTPSGAFFGFGLEGGP